MAKTTRNFMALAVMTACWLGLTTKVTSTYQSVELGQRSIETLRQIEIRLDSCQTGQGALAFGSVLLEALANSSAAKERAGRYAGQGAVETAQNDTAQQIASWGLSIPNSVPNVWDAVTGLNSACRQHARRDAGFLLAGNEITNEERAFWQDFFDHFGTPGGPQLSGKSYGDPHIVTYDGLRYSFQTVGEFILTRYKHRLFEVQVRQGRVNQSLSLNTAVAMNVRGTRVAIYSDNYPDSDLTTPVRVDGRPVKLSVKQLKLKHGGKLFLSGDKITVRWPSGETVLACLYTRAEHRYIDVFPVVFPRKAWRAEGLLGNANGSPDDDLMFPNGKSIKSGSSYPKLSQLIGSGKFSSALLTTQKLYLKKVAQDFGNSWRVTAAESLFDYKPGQSTSTFTDRSFPVEYLVLGQLSPAAVRDAQQVCQQEKVSAADMASCVFDVGFSRSQGFARSTAQVSQVLGTLKSLGIDIPSQLPTTKDDIKQEIKSRIKKNVPGQLKDKLKLPM